MESMQNTVAFAPSPTGDSSPVWELTSPKWETVSSPSITLSPLNPYENDYRLFDDDSVCILSDSSVIDDNLPINDILSCLDDDDCASALESSDEEVAFIKTDDIEDANIVNGILNSFDDDWKEFVIDEITKSEPLPFSDWLEDKITLPLFNSIDGTYPNGKVHDVEINGHPQTLINASAFNQLNYTVTLPQNEYVSVQPVPVQELNDKQNEILLREFETVYGDIKRGANNVLDLTPPQSPPRYKYHVAQLPSQNDFNYHGTTGYVYTPTENTVNVVETSDNYTGAQLQLPPTPPPGQIDWLNTAVNGDKWSGLQTTSNDAWIENLVASPKSWVSNDERQNLDSNGYTSSDASVMSSPERSPNHQTFSSASSDTGDERVLSKATRKLPIRQSIKFVNDPNDTNDGDDDETGDDASCSGKSRKTTRTRKRTSSKPYDREDRKIRKKEQNKNAATRYRQKKKAEVEVILSEEKLLEDENDRINTRVTDLTREINYLKGLLRDLFKAKGLY